MPNQSTGTEAVLDLPGLQALVDALAATHTVIGPQVSDGAIVLGPLARVDQLPVGMGDDQDAGSYRLRERTDRAVFGYAASAVPAKRWVFPPREPMSRTHDDGTTVSVEPVLARPQRPVALFGVRSCDLAALAVHDRALLARPVPDPWYAQRRAGLFIVVAACTTPARSCFCVSMGTGPAPGAGFDLSLTELVEGEHRFLVTSGSPAGEQLLARLPTRAADTVDRSAADAALRQAAESMTRAMPTDGLAALLLGQPEHPAWAEVAQRCLACGNCTLACPTCFCTSIVETAELGSPVSERARVWDSCFTADFSHMHGGSVRTGISARYRQWMTHKLGAWVEQFGVSGCVGCGRCITWCPVGIDITEQARALARPAGQEPRERKP